MIISLIYFAKPVTKGLLSLTKSSLVKASGCSSLKWLIFLYLLGTVGSVSLFHLLVPEVPLWIPLMLSVGISILNGIISVVSIGVTGVSLSVPPEWNIAVYLSGYRGVAAWVFTPIIGGLPSSEGGSPGWTYMIKVGSLVGTKPMDIIKALIFSIIIYNILSFIWMEFLLEDITDIICKLPLRASHMANADNKQRSLDDRANRHKGLATVRFVLRFAGDLPRW